MPFQSMILLVLLNYVYSADKIISYKYKNVIGRPSISSEIPNENRTITPFINLFHPFTLIDSIDYKDLDKSKILNTKHMQFKYDFSLYEYKEDFTFSNIMIKDYHYYINSISSWFPDQGIGFGYNINDTNFSIIAQLYIKNLIDKKILSISFEDKEASGYLYFGGIPNNESLDTLSKGVCQLEKKYRRWGCQITEITIGNSIYNKTMDSVFHNNFYGVFYSSSLFDFIRYNILYQEIKDGNCTVFTGDDERLFMTCHELYNRNQTIDFNFKGTIIKIPIIELFEISPSSMKSLFFSNGYEFYKKYDIIFGIHFFRLFDYLSFDYTKGEISMYSKSVEIISHRGNNSSIRIVIHINTFLSIINITHIILILFKFKYT